MSEIQPIQWFPGHMAKTRRLITENLRLVDCVAELIDARIPSSSVNPMLEELLLDKPRIILLNKAGLADEARTAEWVSFFKNSGRVALPTDCKTGLGLKQFVPALRGLLKDAIERNARKGMQGKSLRVMVVGIPNSGKSTFINRMAGVSRAKAENRPGVTRGKQWITISSGLEMLDMPGLLWPKFDDAAVGEHLAFTGAVKDDVIDPVSVAGGLAEFLSGDYPEALKKRYKIDALPDSSAPGYGTAVLEQIARKRGMLVSGGEPDLERAASVLLEEFRSGSLGRITIEKAEENS